MFVSVHAVATSKLRGTGFVASRGGHGAHANTEGTIELVAGAPFGDLRVGGKIVAPDSLRTGARKKHENQVGKVP